MDEDKKKELEDLISEVKEFLKRIKEEYSESLE